VTALPAARLVIDDRGQFGVLGTAGDALSPARLWLASQRELAATLEMFLGLADGTAYFADVVPAGVPGVPAWAPLRAIGAELDALESGLATTALALANWHAAHPRCPRCGARTEVAERGWRRDCPQDGSSHFPRTDPAVIALLIDSDGCALLGRSGRWPEGAYSTLAGFVEPGETAEAAVLREMEEEVGLLASHVTYLGSQPWPFPASLMLGYHAHIDGHAPSPAVDGVEILHARWVTRESLPSLCRDGSVLLPARISIANRLIARWYGAQIPAGWCRW
jgi:NAD+ diphosphatase